jgi:DNA-binding NarL/FixJ family response regulator
LKCLDFHPQRANSISPAGVVFAGGRAGILSINATAGSAMDLRTPGLDDFEAIKSTKNSIPVGNIICLTMPDEQLFVDHIAESAASEYLLKNAG